MLSACAIIEAPVNTSESSESALTQAEANANPLKIYPIFQTRRALLDTLPIGSIVPVFSAKVSRLPENWMYANGDVIQDNRSPLHGLQLPNLNNGTFLMGSSQNNGQFGGSNRLRLDGAHIHDHTGTTEIVNTNGKNFKVEGADDDQVRLPSMDHRHSISRSVKSAHNHGGDTRPKWVGVLYIIRIW